MEKDTFVKAVDVYYEGVLRDIRKSKNPIQPIYEAITNSLESIILLPQKKDKGYIKIKLYFNKDLIGDYLTFARVVIDDSGIGFDEENFDRLKRYRDTRKGHNNRGSGRIQLLHFFNESEYKSIFRDETGFRQRSFTLSKSNSYLDKNAIIFYHDTVDVESQEPITTLTLKGLLDKKDQAYYDTFSVDDLKEQLISHYILYFCTHRETMPDIQLKQYLDNQIQRDIRLKPDDIPNFDKEEKKITLYYSKLSTDGKSIEKTERKEIFNLKAFKIDIDKLEKNEIKLTSKEEVRDDVKIRLDSLSPKDHINKKRYLFLLSGDYIDEKDRDTRGLIDIPSKEDFKKAYSEQGEMFSEEILLDDIQSNTNDVILSMYEEIKNKTEAKKQEIEKLKLMFLLNEATVNSLRFTLNEPDEKILERVYHADAKIIAKKDAEIKKQIEFLDNLDTSSSDYNDMFVNAISELVKTIPLQNRTALTHYVARRKLVLDLFSKILDKQLKVQQSNSQNIDEKLLHNLIFQQSSNDPDESDLWLINEEFIYFKGASEKGLGDIEINGRKILKNKLTVDEEKYRLSLDEDRYKKRPDVLLFPNEGKCIIIEFKSPKINISGYLTQINNYASLIRNLSKDEFRFNTFYGYLIGEKIDVNDVRAYDADFKSAYHFDYVLRPYKTIAGMFGRSDGSLYTEVIKYSILLQRAKKRNEIFIKKLTESISR